MEASSNVRASSKKLSLKHAPTNVVALEPLSGGNGCGSLGLPSEEYDTEHPLRLDKFEILEDGEVQAKSSAQLVMLTVGLAGLQVAFSVQFSEGTHFLLSLGTSSILISAIWLAPPLCGAFLQPIFGAWSDSCSSRWGRRKPFILLGGIGLVGSLLGMSWVSQSIQTSNEACSKATITCGTAQALGTLAILFLNVSAQAVQVGIRSMIVDQCPSDQQSRVNAWGTRMINIANIYSYLLSYVDLAKAFPFMGNSQLNSLTIFDSLVIVLSLGVTCLSLSDKPSRGLAHGSRRRMLTGIISQIRKVPGLMAPEIVKIQIVQFFSWFAWFPFMLYISSYIGSTHLGEHQAMNPYRSPPFWAGVQASLYRKGSLGLLFQAVAALLTIIILPRIFQKLSSDYENNAMSTELSNGIENKRTLTWLTHRHAWLGSQLLFSLTTIGILCTGSSTIMIILMAITGVCWSVMQWVPFVLLNLEILYEKTNSEYEDENNVATVIGVNNVSIALPQILAMLICTIVFSLVDDKAHEVPVNGIRWVLGGTSVVSVIAAALVLQLKRSGMGYQKVLSGPHQDAS